MIEQWKWIPGYEGFYKVSNLGRVKSVGRNSWNGRNFWRTKTRILTNTSFRSGYPVVNLCKNGKCKVYYVHDLILTSFVGPRPASKCCRHLNDNKENNTLTNLKWGTRTENWRDAVNNGLLNHQPYHPSDSIVKSIRLYCKRHGHGSQTRMARLYGLSTCHVSNIVNNKRRSAR